MSTSIYSAVSPPHTVRFLFIDDKNHYVYQADNPAKAVCTAVVPVLVTRSSILSKIVQQGVHSRQSYYFKQLMGMMFQWEYQLVTGKFGMLFGFENIKGNYIAPKTRFATYPSYPNTNVKLSHKCMKYFLDSLLTNILKGKNVSCSQ